MKDLESLGLVGEAPKPKTEVATTLKEEYRTRLTRKNSQASNTRVADGNKASAQERLERVWTKLKLPDRMKLDMAVKYRCGDNVSVTICSFSFLRRVLNSLLSVDSAALRSTWTS